MSNRVVSVAIALLAAGPVGAFLRAQSAQAPPPVAPISFATDIQPIFERRCLSCHGETMQGGKFDLRSRDSALQGGTRGSDVVPGSAEQSRVYRRIAGLERPSMPAQGGALAADEVAAIKRWIDEGARLGCCDTRRDLLGIQAAAAGAAAGGRRQRFHQSDRSISRRRAARASTESRAARQSPHPGPPRLSRSARPAADAGASRRVRRRIARRTPGSG